MSDRKTQRTPAVPFHDPPPAPEAVSRNKAIIDRAKSRQTARPGDMKDVPDFGDHPRGWTPDDPRADSPRQVSEKTAQGLETLAQVQQPRRQAAPAAAPSTYPPAAPEAAPEAAPPAAPSRLKSEDQQIREAVESRLSPMDIGQYLMSGGDLTQEVPIISDKLVVVFRLATDAEEAFVDKMLRKENDEAKGLTDREITRRLNEWSLASHVVSVNGASWGHTLKADGAVNEEAMHARMGRVRRLHGPILSLILTNLSWFLERTTKVLTFETLKNG